jgi:hypothetical protein
MGGYDDLPFSLKWSLPWRRLWSSTWSRRSTCGGRWFPIEAFLIGWMGIGIPYMISNNIAFLYLSDTFETFPESPWDRQIPVIPWMIFPYAGLYFFYPGVLALTPNTDKGRMELLSTQQMMVTITLTCVCIFMILPAEIDMRDEIDWAVMTDAEASMFHFIHEGDHPWNAWPSLHVIHSYLLARVMTMWCRTDYVKSIFSKPFLVILWTEWILLVFSTMATKQHYIFDAVSGLIVALTMFKLWEPAFHYIDVKGPEHIAQDLGWGTTLKTSIQAVRLEDWPDDNLDDDEVNLNV